MAFTLSVSKVKTYDHCAAKYKYSYILKLPKQDQIHLHLGNAVHEILEIFHQKYIDGSQEPHHDILVAIYKTVIKSYKNKLNSDSIQEIKDILKNYLIYLQNNPLEIATIKTVEKPFKLNLTEDIILTGKIDRIQEDSDGIIHIADYKTNKNIKYIKNDFMQLATYCLALHNENKNLTKFRASYIMLRHNFQRISKEFELAEILSLEQKYLDYVDKIEKDNDFIPSTGPLCSFCDYLSQCSAGQNYLAKKTKLKIGEVSW